MKLWLLTPNFPPEIGGVQTYSFELAKALHSKVSEFKVVAPLARGAQASDQTLPFQVERIPARFDNMALSSILPLRWMIKRDAPDAICATHWSAAFAALKAKSDAQIKVFCSVHGKELLIHPLRRWPMLQSAYNKIRRHALHECDGFFPVSRFTAQLLQQQEVSEARIKFVPNGVNPEGFILEDKTQACKKLLLDPSRPILLTVARLVPRKGIDCVIRALPRLISKWNSLEYHIVGRGKDRTRLEKLARELGVDRRVIFHEQVSPKELSNYYNACDVFVMPARNQAEDVEGFGLVFLEAGMHEKPVIGTTSGGIPDAIKEDSNGFLIPPDDVEQLSQTLSRLLSDAELSRSLGREGRKRALEEFSWERAASTICDAVSSS